MSNPSRKKPDADERQRALKAMELRVQGHPYAQIAAALDYADESGARHAVSRLLARREVESIDELRAVHGARLEGVLSSFWAAATSGDAEAARIVLRTLDSIAKLYGLDAPTRVAAGQPVSAVEFAEEAARLIESIASMGGTDDLLRSLPGGAGQAVLEARESAAWPEGDEPAAEGSTFSGAGSAAMVSDVENWSNIGTDDVPIVSPSPSPSPSRLPVAEPEPVTVVEAEAQAESEASPQGVPLTRVTPWARINERYDPLASWRR